MAYRVHLGSLGVYVVFTESVTTDDLKGAVNKIIEYFSFEKVSYIILDFQENSDTLINKSELLNILKIHLTILTRSSKIIYCIISNNDDMKNFIHNNAKELPAERTAVVYNLDQAASWISENLIF